MGSTVYIQNEPINHIRLKNDTGAALAQYEFVVIGGLCLVADEAIANGSVGSFHVEELVIQVDDLVSGEDTFGTENAPVYWKPSTGEFSDTAQEGYYKVGIVKIVKDSGGMVEVLKAREAVELGDVVAPGQIGYIDYQVAADASSGIDVDFGFNFTILDVIAFSEATVASETLTLQDSSGNAITNAIDIDTIDTRFAAGTIDGASNGYNAIADGTVKFVAASAAGRARVLLLVKGA